ncbi:c-type cytochrome [Legionella sp. km772]|uniref:c-type cytochrome n=1 Tax=Legionella sp. km772 TaxID=2498111 RepID=UPI003519E311
MSQRISIAFTLVTLVSLGQVYAEPLNGSVSSSDKPSGHEQLIDGYYPAYPPTTPAAGQEDLVKRGEYLAKMGDCIACHTDGRSNKGPYAGGLAIETPFGTFYSPNITPDKETGIGKWTEQDFIRALKEGRDPQGRNYFPVFPYIYFSKISDDDARALYAYFMSIPAIHQENTPLGFPFGVPGARLSLWGWNMLFFFPDNSPIEYRNDQTPEWNRGKYIVDGLGHCSMCHTPLNLAGSPKQRYYLTGGFIDGFWAPNITKWGLESATHEEVVDVFKKDKLINNAGPVAGPMAEVNHDSLKYLTDADMMAIATYIKTVESEEPLGLPPSNAKPSLARGRLVYTTACVICHQNGEMSAPLIGDASNWYMRLNDSGLEGLYRHAIDGFNSMPPKGACVTCSDNDIISAVDYLLDESLTRAQARQIQTKSSENSPHHDEGKNPTKSEESSSLK